MLILLLQALDFRSNNDSHQSVIEAVALIRRYVDSSERWYPDKEAPLEGVVREQWKDAVLEQDPSGHIRINKITYEIAVLQALRDRLRCKEVWVVGSNRYCNPDEDLPQDFDQRRDEYYVALRLTQDGRAFVDQIRLEMEKNLEELNEGLPDNAQVRILKKNGGWISLSPLPVQAEPQNLTALKTQMRELWPMTSLLDILKETDLRENFTACFRSATAWENLDRALIRERVLLTLYALGSNTGIKRVSAGQPGTTARDLLYVRRRYVTKDQLREAIRKVVNAIFRIRLPAIWGDATTACASDSTKFGAWDQNLITEWHARYGGPGIMVYWHVDRKAACIYSQLKNCSSSEVAAMIDGVLRHCTDMSVERQYVDSHGQSEVAFAFCRLLGFDLLPRLKLIHNQKLYRPKAGEADRFDHLQSVLTRPIDWNLIGQEYDRMVKYSTALRLGTAQSEDILRRFTRLNIQHPTYRALAELGKAVKTTFLCRYLRLPGLRREIHEGLNVIENWNAVNDFIYFGKGGEMTSNRTDDFEISMLSLHLLSELSGLHQYTDDSAGSGRA